jgi:hypothetical protein
MGEKVHSVIFVMITHCWKYVFCKESPLNPVWESQQHLFDHPTQNRFLQIFISKSLHSLLKQHHEQNVCNFFAKPNVLCFVMKGAIFTINAVKLNSQHHFTQTYKHKLNLH